MRYKATHKVLVHNLGRVLGHASTLANNVEVSIGNESVALWHTRIVEHVLPTSDIACQHQSWLDRVNLPFLNGQQTWEVGNWLTT